MSPYTGTQMQTSCIRAGMFVCAALCMGIVLSGCIRESSRSIRKKFDAVVVHDLESLVAQLPDTSVADSPAYTVISYEEFDEGEYIAKAVVDFYVLRGVRMKVRRKYRYHRFQGKWERYYNQWEYALEPERSGDSLP